MTGIIEPCPIADVFCEALEELERLGPCTRLTFTVTQPATLEADGKPGKVVVARLVIPTENLRVIAQQLTSLGTSTPTVAPHRQGALQ